MFAFIGGIGPTELAIVLVIVLVLFGAGKLPQVFEAFGKGMKNFKDAQKDPPRDVTPTLTSDPMRDEVADAREVASSHNS